MHTTSRWRYAFKLSFAHLSASLLVAALSAALVWQGWYVFPYSAMLGISGLYLLIITVDVICGPLLTLVVANPEKSRRETALDLSLIAVIQLSALLYGLHTLYAARPVAVAFETDRLVVVAANEIYSPAEPVNLPFWGIKYVNVRAPKDGDERLNILALSFQGVNPSMQPDWWEDYAHASDGINAKAKDLSALTQARPHKLPELQAIAEKAGQAIQDLRFIPFVSSKDLDWVAILDNDNQIIDYANIDGFIKTTK